MKFPKMFVEFLFFFEADFREKFVDVFYFCFHFTNDRQGH